MNHRLTKPSFRLVFAAAGLVGALASVHCGSASSEATVSRPEDDVGDAGGSAALPGQRGDAGTEGDLSPTPPNAGEVPTLDSNLLLVNAAKTFSAFRVCPAMAVGLGSESRSAPQPTTLMPQSSLAGVDVNGAASIAPQPDFANATDVLVLRIDEQTKIMAEDLKTGTCETLACTSGSGCIGAGKLFRVPVVENGVPAKGAFASKGKILALRGDDTNLRFEVIPIDNIQVRGADALRIEYRNLSDFGGPVSFVRGDAGAGTSITEGAGTELTIGRDYATARFVAGSYASSLLDIHEASNPRVAITDFYVSPGTFGLVLLGQTGDAGPGRGLRFLMVPVSSRSVLSADAGTD